MLRATVDEGGGLAAESVGEILLFGDGLPAAHDRIAAGWGRIHVGVRAAEEAEKLVEAAAERMPLLLETEVPLADDPGGVARGLEPLRENRLGEREADVLVGHEDRARIELVAEALLIAAGHQRGPRGTAIGAAHVAVGEAHAVLRERVEMGRGNVLTAVGAGVGVSVIVGHDDQDIGFDGGSGGGKRRGGEECAREEEESVHGVERQGR